MTQSKSHVMGHVTRSKGHVTGHVTSLLLDSWLEGCSDERGLSLLEREVESVGDGEERLVCVCVCVCV